jgi:hypothetical protein
MPGSEWKRTANVTATIPRDKPRAAKKVRLHIDRRAGELLAKGSNGDEEDLLTVQQMCDWFKVSVQWFDIGRMKPDRVPFVRFPNGEVRYRRSTVIKWLKKREYQSTADYAVTRDRPRKLVAEA